MKSERYRKAVAPYLQPEMARRYWANAAMWNVVERERSDWLIPDNDRLWVYPWAVWRKAIVPAKATKPGDYRQDIFMERWG